MKVTQGLLLSTALVTIMASPAFAVKTTKFLTTPWSPLQDIKAPNGEVVGNVRFKTYQDTAFEADGKHSYTATACIIDRRFLKASCPREYVDTFVRGTTGTCESQALRPGPAECALTYVPPVVVPPTTPPTTPPVITPPTTHPPTYCPSPPCKNAAIQWDAVPRSFVRTHIRNRLPEKVYSYHLTLADRRRLA